MSLVGVLVKDTTSAWGDLGISAHEVGGIVGTFGCETGFVSSLPYGLYSMISILHL